MPEITRIRDWEEEEDEEEVDGVEDDKSGVRL